MHPSLQSDLENLPTLLRVTVAEAEKFLAGLDRRPVAVSLPEVLPAALPPRPLGAEAALKTFRGRFGSHLSGSTGPRYLGFVTGGTTPAALAADWLVSTYDQNVASTEGSAAALVEAEAIAMLRQLFGLPERFSGNFVTGATMANFVGLAIARQWVGSTSGRDVAESGIREGFPVRVLTATPHASTIKALAMLGLGRSAIEQVATLPGREAIDPAALASALSASNAPPAIVVASACTVNTTDFDSLEEVADLCTRYRAYLHVDAAFGLFAACSPDTADLLRGIERADSITADGHKWLNVPYDCGFLFTKHPELQQQVFRASAPYLEGPPLPVPDSINFTPEGSSRFRGLPVWATLMAYGRDGYRDIVERNCRFARALGEWIAGSPDYELLAPVRLNVVCFRLSDRQLRGGDERVTNRRLLDRLREAGDVFMTPTQYAGHWGVRAAISNWRTTVERHLPIVTAALAAGAGREF